MPSNPVNTSFAMGKQYKIQFHVLYFVETCKLSAFGTGAVLLYFRSAIICCFNGRLNFEGEVEFQNDN